MIATTIGGGGATVGASGATFVTPRGLLFLSRAKQTTTPSKKKKHDPEGRSRLAITLARGRPRCFRRSPWSTTMLPQITPQKLLVLL
jgi:hypothetical protein